MYKLRKPLCFLLEQSNTFSFSFRHYHVVTLMTCNNTASQYLWGRKTQWCIGPKERKLRYFTFNQRFRAMRKGVEYFLLGKECRKLSKLELECSLYFADCREMVKMYKDCVVLVGKIETNIWMVAVITFSGNML